MASQVVAFLRRSRRRTDWSQEEIAELYRIEHALLQARFSLETDRGVSDEGDPWFVFCRADGEVLVHITRSEEGYLLYGLGLSRPLTGRVIGDISKSFVNQIPLNIPVRQKDGPQLFVHPAATLAIIVGMIFLANDDVALISSDRAAEASGGDGAEPVDRSVKAAVLAMLGKLADGTLFAGARPEASHQEGNYLNIVCTIAAVMMGASVALDAGTQEFITAVVDNVVDASVDSAQAHQASPDVADSGMAIQPEGAGGDPLSADRAMALSSAPFDDAAPSEAATKHTNAVVMPDAPQQKVAIDAVTSLGHQTSDLGIDGSVFGLQRPLADIEARGHTDASQHQEAARPTLTVAPASVTLPAEAVVEGAKQTSSDAPTKATSGHHDAGTTLLEAQFHDLFKSVGLSDTIQVDRVVTHVTLETLQSLVQPVIGPATKAEPVSVASTEGHGVVAPGNGLVFARTDVAAAPPTTGVTSVAVTAPPSDAVQGNLHRLFDLAAREILFTFFQENPNAQAIFYGGNALVFDPDDYSEAGPSVVKVWETDSGNTITLVGHAPEVVHV